MRSNTTGNLSNENLSTPTLRRSASSPLILSGTGETSSKQFDSGSFDVPPLDLSPLALNESALSTSTSLLTQIFAPTVQSVQREPVDQTQDTVTEINRKVTIAPGMERDAAERTAKHIINETIEILSWVKAGGSSKVVLHYPRELFETMKTVTQNIPTLLHLRDTKKLDKLTAKLRDATVYIPICYGTPEELSADDLTKIVSAYKAKNVANIYIYLGEYENILLPNTLLKATQDRAFASWSEKNQLLLNSMPPNVSVVKRIDWQEQSSYKEASSTFRETLLSESIFDALHQDVSTFLNRKASQEKKQAPVIAPSYHPATSAEVVKPSLPDAEILQMMLSRLVANPDPQMAQALGVLYVTITQGNKQPNFLGRLSMFSVSAPTLVPSTGGVMSPRSSMKFSATEL